MIFKKELSSDSQFVLLIHWYTCFITGVFVIGSGDQGILYEHREQEFGDYANTTEVLNAALKIETSKIDSKL